MPKAKREAPEVHPAAAVWPMLPDDELAELGRSIEELGLLEPLVRTPDGLLLEGRNRLAACQLVGVEPTWVTYDGDPVAFVIARNATRRHLTTPQRAMAVAMVLATDGKRRNGRWERGSVPATSDNRSWPQTMAMAGQVLDHAPDLAPLVLSGARKLGEAHAEATRRRTEADTEDAKLGRLAEAAPDLAEQVREGTLTLAEAEAAARQRAADRDLAIRDGRHYASKLAADFTAAVLAVVGGIEAEADPPVRVPDDDIEQVQQALALLLKRQAEPEEAP